MNGVPFWSPYGRNMLGASAGSTPSGVSFQFDGVDDYVAADGAASVIDFNNDAHSVSTWFKMAPTGVSLSALWAFTNSSATHSRYWLSISSGGSVVVYGWGNVSGTYPIGSGGAPVTSGSGLDDNAWHNIVVTYDGSTALKIYIDGGTPSTFVVGAGALTSDTLTFGARRIGGVTSFAANALVFRTTVYTSELSSGDVALIYNGGQSYNEDLLPTSPDHFYRFGNGDVLFPIVKDYGSTPQNGTAVNMTPQSIVNDAP